MHTAADNTDPREVEKFDRLAVRWWHPAGEMRPLHDLNPARMRFIRQCAAAGGGELAGKQALDIGCGGGILSEALARAGARVTAIDMAQQTIAVARAHATQSGLEIDYQHSSAEQLAAAHSGAYDIVALLELIEHVPDPAALMRSAAALARPGGRVFVSTVNRTPKAYVLAVLAAEYVFGLLPKGTHDYARFIRPSELARMARRAGLVLQRQSGLKYNPLTRGATLAQDVAVNYLMCFTKPADAGA